MIIKSELWILGALKVISHNAPFWTLHSDTNISDKEHRSFFKKFVNCMYKIREDFISYPSTKDELDEVMHCYTQKFLSGCGKSVNVIHLKESNCTVGDVNWYPSLAFEVIKGCDRQILGVLMAHFGTRNNKQIVHRDETINLVRKSWYKNVNGNCMMGIEMRNRIQVCISYVMAVIFVGQSSSALLSTSQCHHRKAISLQKLKVSEKVWSVYLV